MLFMLFLLLLLLSAPWHIRTIGPAGCPRVLFYFFRLFVFFVEPNPPPPTPHVPRPALRHMAPSSICAGNQCTYICAYIHTHIYLYIYVYICMDIYVRPDPGEQDYRFGPFACTRFRIWASLLRFVHFLMRTRIAEVGGRRRGQCACGDCWSGTVIYFYIFYFSFAHAHNKTHKKRRLYSLQKTKKR